MYQIYMRMRTMNNRLVEMEEIESVFEGQKRCDLYKRKNKSQDFVLVNKDNGDLEYETPTIY